MTYARIYKIWMCLNLTNDPNNLPMGDYFAMKCSSFS